MKKPWKALRSTNRTWKAVEALASPNPVTVSAPKSHVSPKRNMIPVILMSSFMAVFFWLTCSLVRLRVFRECLMRTPITMTKMTTLKSRMIKMGPRKVAKNTAGSEMKQLWRRNKNKAMRMLLSMSICVYMDYRGIYIIHQLTILGLLLCVCVQQDPCGLHLRGLQPSGSPQE